ncbi:MAG: hypothetical protein FJ110_09625 [Deltaproteobacteria bacterium]|nr:hypothetical protein [Deltaproteobacteria bacterium]
MFSKEEWENMKEKGSEAMTQALNTFGPSETLNMLLFFSNSDPVMNHLLTKYPSVVATGDFYSRLPVYENRNDKAAEETRVETESETKGEMEKEEPAFREHSSKIFDKSLGPLFEKILNCEVQKPQEEK